jgi:hypothetical protein
LRPDIEDKAAAEPRHPPDGRFVNRAKAIEFTIQKVLIDRQKFSRVSSAFSEVLGVLAYRAVHNPDHVAVEVLTLMDFDYFEA